MPIDYEIIGPIRIDCTTLGTNRVIPVGRFSSMTLDIEPVGTTVSTAVLTMKRGNVDNGNFSDWDGGAVTLNAAGLHPATDVYNVAGFAFVSLEVTAAQSEFAFIVTAYLNDTLSLTSAI